LVFALCTAEFAAVKQAHKVQIKIQVNFGSKIVGNPIRSKNPKYGVTFNEPRRPLANEEASSFIDFRYRAGLKTPVIRRLKFPRFKCERVEKSEKFCIFSKKCSNFSKILNGTRKFKIRLMIGDI